MHAAMHSWAYSVAICCNVKLGPITESEELAKSVVQVIGSGGYLISFVKTAQYFLARIMTVNVEIILQLRYA